MKKTILAAILSAALGAAALAADDYAGLLTKLDEAMKTTQVDEATKAKIDGLKAEGEAKSKAGDAEGSMKSLQEALLLLGVQ
jgi:hypothetical protein